MQLRNAVIAVALGASAVGLAAPAQAQRGFKLTAWPAMEAKQRAVLMELFDATDGPRWKRKTNWGSDKPVCLWEGVSCQWPDGSSDGLIRDLGLRDNRLRGSLPASLSTLPDLVTLDLSDNQLTGQFPASLLQRVDDNQLALAASGNSFGNFLVTVTLQANAVTGFSHHDDVHLRVTLDARRDRATYESQRYQNGPKKDETTYCVASEGPAPDLVLLSRALRHLDFVERQDIDGKPGCCRSDHDVAREVEVTWGDGRRARAVSIGRYARIRTHLVLELVGAAIPPDLSSSAKRVNCKRLTWLPD